MSLYGTWEDKYKYYYVLKVSSRFVESPDRDSEESNEDLLHYAWETDSGVCTQPGAFVLSYLTTGKNTLLGINFANGNFSKWKSTCDCIFRNLSTVGYVKLQLKN